MLSTCERCIKQTSQALVLCCPQMMAAYSWQMYMQAAAMQSAGGAAGMAGMAGMPMPMPMPFMPPPMFMHPDMMSAYGYAPFDFRKRPREWDGGGARRRRRHDNKVRSCDTRCRVQGLDAHGASVDPARALS